MPGNPVYAGKLLLFMQYRKSYYDGFSALPSWTGISKPLATDFTNLRGLFKGSVKIGEICG